MFVLYRFVVVLFFCGLCSLVAQAGPASEISLQVQAPLHAIYEARHFEPLWLEAGRPSDRAVAALALMARATEDGLDPDDYDLPALRQQLGSLQQRSGDDRQQAAFDLALSRALARFVEHLSMGRVAPGKLGLAIDLAAQRTRLPQHLHEVLTGADLSRAIATARPSLPPYAALRALLPVYRELAKQHPQAPALPPLPGKKLEPGKPWAGQAALAGWLMVLGDLPENFAQSALYEGELVAGVKRFQVRHGLTPDGVIGPQTLAALRVSLPQRVQQIELAMERLRWLDDHIVQQRFIVINIPQFTLWAYASGARPVLQMPVVVGEAGRNETPVMVKALSALVFSPYWNVPYSIATRELLPKLRKDHSYLAHEDMEWVDNSGVAHGSAFSRDAESRLILGEYRIRQRAGEKNALGTLKFVFPNDNAIYMHDTPSKKLFAKERRDFSHGCVRVGNPMGLALFALATQGEWNEAKVNATIAASTDRHLSLPERMPVLLLYFTANVAADGRALFLPDIYRQDAPLAAALKARRTQ